MKSQVVRSEDGGKEGTWIAFLITLILLVGWVLLPFNQAFHASSELAKHQLSILQLAPKQLTMVADLRLAHEEIRNIYIDTDQWATIEALEQSWLAPFVKDKSWQHQGKHQWTQIMKGIYQGVPEIGDVRFLLISRQKEVALWLDIQGNASLLMAQTRLPEIASLTNELINAGWLQVVFPSEEPHEH
jgi:hypothetical protein